MGHGCPAGSWSFSSRVRPRLPIGLDGERYRSVCATVCKPLQRLRIAEAGVPLRLPKRRSAGDVSGGKRSAGFCEDKGIIANSRTGKGVPFGHRASRLHHHPPRFAPGSGTGVLPGAAENPARLRELFPCVRWVYGRWRCPARRRLRFPSRPARLNPLSASRPTGGRRTAARGVRSRRPKTYPLDDSCGGALLSKRPEK